MYFFSMSKVSKFSRNELRNHVFHMCVAKSKAMVFGHVWNHRRRLEIAISQANNHPRVPPSEFFVGLYTRWSGSISLCHMPYTQPSN